MKYIDVDLEDLNIYSKLRLLNFCEVEFIHQGQYEINNKEGIYEIMNNYELSNDNVFNMMFNVDDYNNGDVIVYYNHDDNCLYSMGIKELNDDLSVIDDNICNGELREILCDCLGEEIVFD